MVGNTFFFVIRDKFRQKPLHIGIAITCFVMQLIDTQHGMCQKVILHECVSVILG